LHEFYLPMSSSVHVFNQYYWDLLKRLKDVARDKKHASDDKVAKDVLKEMKRSYLTFDKHSLDHVQHFQAGWTPLLEALETPDVIHDQWHENEAVLDVPLYKGIPLSSVLHLLGNHNIVLYYLVLFILFAKDFTKEEVASVLQVLKNEQKPGSADMDAVPEVARGLLEKLFAVMDKQSQQSAPVAEDLYTELEQTSLGKLAKEIMSEVDMEELQNTVGEDGDILKALSNPEGGLTKLLGTVSQKMISKMASGEIQQETLLQDAMKLATSLPGMMPGGPKGGGMGDIMGQFSKIASMFGGDNADMSGLASMMSQFGMGGKTPSHASGSRAMVNQGAMNRVVRAKQMRRKLEQRKKAKENIE
jgi:hypothetical protein